MNDNAIYIDKYGQQWKRIDEWHVWKPDTGVGGWFGGKGLVQL